MTAAERNKKLTREIYTDFRESTSHKRINTVSVRCGHTASLTVRTGVTAVKQPVVAVKKRYFARSKNGQMRELARRVERVMC